MSRHAGQGRPSPRGRAPSPIRGTRTAAWSTLVALLGLSALLAGCADIPRDGWTPYVTPVYVLDPVNPEIPTPIDIVGVTYDPASGVEVGVPADASPAYAALLEGFVNTLDGWALNSSIEFEFSGDVKLDTVTADTVVVLDLGAAPAFDPASGAPILDVAGARRLAGLAPVAAFDEESGRTAVTISSPTPLPRGRVLGVLVRGGSAEGVLDAAGTPIETPVTFTFLKATEPLFQELAKDGGGTRIVSNIVLPADTPEDVASLRLLEGMRLTYAPALAALAAGQIQDVPAVPRDEVALFWTFTTQSATIAQFDPLYEVIPTPNDLLFVGDKLNFPEDETDPAAQQALFAWLNTLDGFSLLSVPELAFSGPVDPATLTPSSVRVFDVTTPEAVGEVGGIVRDWDAATNSLVLRQEAPGTVFQHAHRYAVVVLSGPAADGGEPEGVLTPEGAAVGRSQAMALGLLPEPLYDAAAGTSLLPVLAAEQAQQFEAVRSGLDAVAGVLSEQYQLDRARIASLFTFTIGTAAESVVDPDAGVVPTPNDLVLLPDTIGELIAAAQSPAEEAFFTWLSEQGGWSAVISGATAFSAPLDPETIPAAFHVFEISVLLNEIDDVVVDLPPEGTPVTEIAFHRVSPWQPGTKYFAVITDDLRTADGQPVLPSSFAVLVRGENALFDEGTGSQVPALVSDADAVTLEQFRAATAAPLTAALDLLGRDRENVLAHWVFTIHPDNEALYSPTTGFLPFPNEVLQNTAIDTEADPPRPAPGILLPITVEPGSPFEAVFAYLATRDGFSVLDPATTTFLGDLDPASLTAATAITEVPTKGIGFADLTDVEIQPGQPLTTADLLRIKVKEPRIEFDPDTNILAIGPRFGRPLLENHRLMVALTDKLESADDQPIHISPTFFFARSPEPLAEEGESLVASLTDAQAVQLEQLRQAYAPMFEGFDAVGDLFPGFSRESVLLFWTFWTQGITAELQALRAAVTATPVAAGDITGTRRNGPAAVASTPEYSAILNGPEDENTVLNVAEAIIGGKLPARYLLSQTDLGTQSAPEYGSFASRDPANPQWVDTEPVGVPPRELDDISFDLFLPSFEQRTEPFEVVVYAHGIFGRRQDVVRNGLLDALLGAGYAVLTIDLPLHGERAWSTGVVSGDGFLAPDLLALRDHLVQGAVDLHQVANAIATGLDPFLLDKLGRNENDHVIRTDRVAFFGVSLGAVVGTPFAATSPMVGRMVLHAPGGHFQRIVRETQATWFQDAVRQLLCGALGDQAPAFCEFDPAGADYIPYAGIPWDDPALRQLLMTLQWVLDTGDAVAFAPYVRAHSSFDVTTLGRTVLVQAAADDELFPPASAEELRDALQYESSFVPEYRAYEGACHEFLTMGCGAGAPEGLEAERDAARDDAVAFLRDGTIEP